MKKLMTMIATVAMAFGLYATDTLNNSVDFSTYTDVNPWLLTGSDGSTPDTLWAWTGAATAPETDEAEIKSGALVLATGSNVLSRKFAAETVEANENLYVDMQLNFNGEALDAIPTDADVNGAKLVVFALNTTEWDTPAAGQTLPEGTNFFVMASYGSPAEKALFQINGFDGTTLNDRRLAIKAYKNVVTGGGRGGFLLYISHSGDTGIVPVDVAKVYLFDDNDNIVWTDVMGDNYLGREDIVGNLSKWIGQKSLFVSLDGNPDTYDKFTSVDLKGRAALSSITLSDDSTEWPLDAVSMPLVKSEDVTIELTQESKDAGFVVNADSISAPAAGDFGFTVETEKGEVTVKYGDNEIKPAEDGVYTATLTPGTTALTITGWDVAATVKIGEGDEEKCATIAEAIKKANAANAAATITLVKGDELATLTFENADNEITLDLNGQTLSSVSSDNAVIKNTGLLKIIDSDGSGKVQNTNYAAVENTGALAITAGTYDGMVYNDSETAATAAITVTGGAFDRQNNNKTTIENYADDDYEVVVGTGDLMDYWVVQERQVKNFIIEIVDGDKYESIADALAAAKNNDTLKLLKGITLTETVEINKAITFDLDNFEIKVADGTYGYAAILITESGATIQNGKVTSMASAEVASCFINFAEASGTLKNLTVNTTNFKWGVGGDLGETGDWEKDYNKYTVTCESVDVTGSTSVFCAEGVNLTLDEDCSATQVGTHAQDWRNCAIHAGLNAIVTIAGGEYTGAYAIYKMSSPAKIYVNGGKFTGNVYMHPLQGYEGEDVLAIAAGNFDDNTIDTKYLVNNVDAGYERAWVAGDFEGYVKPGANAITYNITYTFTGVEEADKEKIVNPNASTTTYTIESETITFEDASCDGYEFKGFAPAAITQGSTGDKEIVGTFEKKQQGWPDNPQDVKGQSAGVALGITGKLADADACVLSTWAKDFNVTFNVDVDQYENAFLLNCDPAEVEDAEKAFKFTAITPGTTPTTTKQYKGRDYNGTVQITAYEDVGFTKPVDNPTGAEAELFYKAELILVPVNNK